MADLHDRFLGCLAGLVLGDALGMPVEFLTPEQILENYGRINGIVQALDWHPHHCFKAGSVSDDTWQALAVAHAYSDAGDLSAESVSNELIKWFDRTPREELEVLIGPSTRKALEAIKNGSSVYEAGAQGTTNGAAMRVPPVGLVNMGNFEAILADVIQASLPTHGTAIAISGGAAVAFAVAQALLPHATLPEILDAGKEGAVQSSATGQWHWGTPLEGRIELALNIVDWAENEKTALSDLYRYVGVDMLVAESVATAFGLVKLAQGDPMKAIEYGVNLGGDADTIAAIAGAICGAWKGSSVINHSLLSTIEITNGLNLSWEAQRLFDIMRQKSAQGWIVK